MTCVAAVVHKGAVYMGADSAGTDSGYGLQVRTDPKIFKANGFLFGIAGSFRMGNLLRFAFNPALYNTETDVYEYMCTDFIEAVRSSFIEGGFTYKEHNTEYMDGAFLVAFKAHLFLIEGDFQVGMLADGFAAIGCGADLALGSLFSTQDVQPATRLQTALSASERFCSGVRAPFVFESTR